MSFFSKNQALGVDFGTASIKAVELELRGGKPYLINYGEAELLSPEKKSAMPVRSFKEDATLRFKALLDRLQSKSDGVCISMPAFLGLISLIDFPEMTDQELESAVKFEAKKYVPSALEDVALSWERVGTREHADKDGRAHPSKIEVLLVAALNKDVWQYEGYTKAVARTMNLLELETFSIARSVIGSDPGVFLVIDIGARASNFIIVEDGYVKMSRNLDAGGIDITRTLSEGLNIALDRAETLKTSGKDFLTKAESAIIFPGIEMIVSEGKRMIGIWGEKHPERAIERVILSGGTARFTGLPEYFNGHFGIPVSVADPWRTIVCPEALAPKIEEMGTAFSAAIGLALYGLEIRKNK
jgi:type IV pilus assembly protein PilM